MSTAEPGSGPGLPRPASPRADLALIPAPGAAPRIARWRAQTALEWRLLMTNGEQVLLTLIIPIVALVAVTQLDLADVDAATPGVMALAVLSSAFTATAIATGFERRSGVLKFLGSTPLARSGLLVGKVTATAAVIVVQLLLIGAAAALMGWQPAAASPPVLLLAVALGTAALGSWGFALAGLLRAEATLAVANGIFLLLMLAGGTVLPAERLPGPLADVVELLPSAALGDALRVLLDPALAGAGTPWADLGVLALWTVTGTAVAIRTFRWE